MEQLGHEYNNAMIAVERNNHGFAVIVALEQNGYCNLYRQGGQTGWLTTTASRPRMIERVCGGSAEGARKVREPETAGGM